MATYLQALRLLVIIVTICGLPLRSEGEGTATGTCFGEPNMVVVLQESFALPSCATFTLGVTMKFRYFDKKTNQFMYLAVVVLCPSIYGKKFFVTGGKYRITCKGRIDSGTKRLGDYVIINKYAKEALPTIVADKVVLLQ